MKRVVTECLDDLDGTAGAEPHVLSVDGYTVDIDLCEHNRKQLYEALRPFLDAGKRRTGSRLTPRAHQPKQTAQQVIRSEIRLWWRRNPAGLPTWQARGAIPAIVQEAWEDARGHP